jgi:hypothetical protein
MTLGESPDVIVVAGSAASMVLAYEFLAAGAERQ